MNTFARMNIGKRLGLGFAIILALLIATTAIGIWRLQTVAAATKEIETLIGDSVDKVDAGSKLVEQAGATMQEVVASVKRVADIVAEISSASQEQSVGIEEVNRAVTQMDEVTQQNAALVEQAAAAQSLQDQAANLAQVVSVFKLDRQHAALPQAGQPATSAKVAPLVATGDRQPARPAPPALRASAARPAAPVGGTRAMPNNAGSDDGEEF